MFLCPYVGLFVTLIGVTALHMFSRHYFESAERSGIACVSDTAKQTPHRHLLVFVVLIGVTALQMFNRHYVGLFVAFTSVTALQMFNRHYVGLFVAFTGVTAL